MFNSMFNYSKFTCLALASFFFKKSYYVYIYYKKIEFYLIYYSKSSLKLYYDAINLFTINDLIKTYLLYIIFLILLQIFVPITKEIGFLLFKI